MNYFELKSQLFSLIRGKATSDFNSLALEIYVYQCEANAVYRNYSKQFAVPRDWKSIPAIPLDAFKMSEVTCFPPDSAEAVFHTSGTTGQGVGRHWIRSLEVYREASCRGWQLAGLQERGLFALLSSPEEAPHSSLSRMAGWLIPDHSCFFIRDNKPHWEEMEFRIAETEDPICLFGTALAFLNWFEQIDNRLIRLPQNSIAVETGGYKGSQRTLTKAELYSQFEQRLGLAPTSIVNEYGMTELCSQFYARGIGGVHYPPPWARAIVINPSTGREAEDGATGVLKIIDLANIDSCIALQTRDLAIRRGDDFQLIGRDPAALPRGCSRAAAEILGRPGIA